MRRLGSLISALALVVSGCGDDGDDGTNMLVEDASVDTMFGGTDTLGGTDTGGDTTFGDDTVPAPDTGVPPQDTTVTQTSYLCDENLYSETPPSPNASVASAVAAFNASNRVPFIYQSLEARYPIGRYITEQGQLRGAFDNCAEIFLGNASTPVEVMNRLSTVVHECGHSLDLSIGEFGEDTFVFRPDLQLTCKDGDTTDRYGKTFARSLINGDAYAATNPDDFYRDVYMDGDPFNAAFEGGDQGFNSVVEEATQYINSLATDYAFEDQFGGYSTSARDGILTFLWYIERYLKLARESYPGVYQFISGDACYREAVLTVWARAWFYLNLTEGRPALEIDGPTLKPLVLSADLANEIQLLRQAHGCQ